MSERITQHSTRNFGTSSAGVILSMRHSQKAMHAMLSICLGHFDLNVAQWMLVSTLAQSEPITPATIAKKLDFKRPYVSILIREITQKGNYIDASAKSDDTRTKTLGLTTQGKLFFTEIEEKLQHCIDRELKQKISSSELDIYFKISNFIGANVKHRSL